MCRSIALQTYHLEILANYKLEPLWAKSTTPSDNITIYTTSKVGKAIYQQLMKDLKLSDEKCKMLKTRVYAAYEQRNVSGWTWGPFKRPSFYFATPRYFTDRTCQGNHIARKMEEMINKMLSVKIKGEGMLYFTVQEAPESLLEHPGQFGEIEIYKSVRINLNLKSVYYYQLTTCPTVKFTKSEYLAIMGNITDTGRRNAVMSVFNQTAFNDDSESETNVCLGDYMLAVVNTASVNGQGMIVFICIYYMLCFYSFPNV